MKDYKKYNAENVLEQVEAYIEYLDKKYKEEKAYGYVFRERTTLKILDVCDELSIFDWWNERLSRTQLKDMRKFLKEAIKLGYTGYVCFKVGATGCANGMWAYKEEITNGYSPEGPELYKSFTPSYEYWAINPAGDKWYPEGGRHDVEETEDLAYDALTTIKKLEGYMQAKGF